MTTPSKNITTIGSASIAYRQRLSQKHDTIVFIHGYGSAMEHFRYAFDSSILNDFSLVTLDLVGFGESRGPDDFGYSMREQAEIILGLLNKLGIDSFHLCAHSMGGLVALEFVELAPERVLSFINLEGNLTPEDCFFSGKVVRTSFEDFREKGRSKFEEELRRAGRKDSSLLEYAETFSRASTSALYKSAQHTIEDSAKPLIEKFVKIENICYIYGEKNRGVFPSENLLRSKGVPIFFIEDSGHSMATDNPEQLYEVIGSCISEYN